METTEEYTRTRQILFDRAIIRPQSNIVETSGPVKNVHYLETGHGKPLIIIHGAGSHASDWINIMGPLAEHYHLYVVDLPGHGLTDSFNYRGVAYREVAVAFVKSVMDALDLKTTYLMGNSMGGFFSISFTMEHPERVEKLLLIGAPAGVNRWIPYVLRLLGWNGINRLFMNTIARPSVSGMKTIHRQLLVADVSKISGEHLKHFYFREILPGNRKGVRTMLENTVTLKGFRKDLFIGDKLDRLHVPVRFIWGDKDAFEKPETGKVKASAIKDYKFVAVENAGHMPWLDQPEKCVSLILQMLEN